MKIFIYLLLIVNLFGEVVNNNIRFSFTNIKFNNEHLGLLESSYLFDFNHFYTGFGVYSAITGKRGGFFVGGIDMGLNYKINSIDLVGGVFIGGGGGGSAPQGGGLMSKTYIGLKYQNFGVGINKIKFINGDIDSNALYLFYDKKFKDYYFFSIPKNVTGNIENITFSPFYETYYPINSKTTNNQKQLPFGIVGAEININHTLIDVGGALKGDSDGYAEIYFGKEKIFPYFKLKGFIGASGGGKVDTKGGLGAKLSASTKFSYFNLEGGLAKSMGSFKSYFIKASIDKKFNLIIPGKQTIDNFIAKNLEFKIYNERYLKAIKKNGKTFKLDNLVMDLNYFINDYLFLGVSASAAIDGDSGGYATGLWNVGVRYQNIFTQISIGAAGGGGIDVNGGLISKVEVGYNLKRFFASMGKLNSKGKLNTIYFNIGYKIDFYKLVK